MESAGKELGVRAPAPLGEHRACGALRLARRAELATLEAVEQTLGGEEAEAARIPRDDAGGAVVDFDDVSVRLNSGHDCSFAGISALLSLDLLGGVLLGGGGQQQQQAPVAAEKQRRVMHACMSF